MYVLGIDGGGTKTKGVIANLTGKIIAEAIVGATNPNSIPVEGVEAEFRELFSLLDNESNHRLSQVKHVFAGMSGVDNFTSKKKMQDLITSIMGISCKVTVDNDAITALYSGTLGASGVVQIAGTGSITYGLNGKGKRNRVGGWGYLIGEKGSGFALGRDGLDAAFMAHDGLQGPTEIKKLLLDHFQENSLPNIIQPVYQGENVKELIASLSKLVIEAADNGDRIAGDIIRKNGLQMGESIVCLIENLFTEEERAVGTPVVLAGGLFNRFDLFRAPMEEVIRNSMLDAQLIVPRMDPVGGAVIAALREENVEITNHFPDNFCSSEKE